MRRSGCCSTPICTIKSSMKPGALTALRSARLLDQMPTEASAPAACIVGYRWGYLAHPTPAQPVSSRSYDRFRIRPREPSRDVHIRPARRASLILITRALHPQTSTNVRPQPTHLWGYIWGYRQDSSPAHDDPCGSTSSCHPHRKCRERLYPDFDAGWRPQVALICTQAIFGKPT